MAQSSTSIYLSWNQPDLDDRNGRITGYRISYYPQANNGSIMTVMVNTSSADVPELEKYTSYCFKVAARSHFTPTVGDTYGPDSQPVCNRTNEDGNVKCPA